MSAKTSTGSQQYPPPVADVSPPVPSQMPRHTRTIIQPSSPIHKPEPYRISPPCSPVIHDNFSPKFEFEHSPATKAKLVQHQKAIDEIMSRAEEDQEYFQGYRVVDSSNNKSLKPGELLRMPEIEVIKGTYGMPHRGEMGRHSYQAGVLSSIKQRPAVSPDTFYSKTNTQPPSARKLPALHPSSRIVQSGQVYRVPSFNTSRTLLSKEAALRDQEVNDRFYKKRRLEESRAGPSREVFRK